MSRDNNDIQPGDVVLVHTHEKAARLYPDRKWTVPREGGWVVTGMSTFGEQPHDPKWPSPRDCFVLEKPPVPDDGWQSNRMEFAHREHLSIERKGTGVFIRGVDLPFTKAELQAQELKEFKGRAAWAIVERGTHEGWANPATWHVHFQLTNCQSFMQGGMLYSLCRKDGTINPNRLIKAWRDLKRMKMVQPVEDWMYALPLEIPAKFARHSFKDIQDAHLRVDWFEITAEFNRSKP